MDKIRLADKDVVVEISKDEFLQALHDEYTEGLEEYDKDFLYTVKGIVSCTIDRIIEGPEDEDAS